MASLHGSISAGAENLQASLNIGGASSNNKPYFIGDISDFTEENPLYLNDLTPGQYIFANKFGLTYFYISATYQGQKIINLCNVRTQGFMYADSIILNMYQKIDDSLESGSHICNLSYIDTDETTGKIDFKDVLILLYSDFIDSSVGFTQTFNNLTTDLNQTITGLKTFNTLPESSIIPTNVNQFVNKEYVDNKIEISSINEKGIYDDNPIILEDLKIGTYRSGNKFPLYYKIKNTSAVESIIEINGVSMILFVCKTIKDIEDYYEATPQQTDDVYFGYIYVILSTGQFIVKTLLYKRNNLTMNFANYAMYNHPQFLTDANQNIVGIKNFASIPRLNTLQTPTLDTHLTPKKYVDDSISQRAEIPAASEDYLGKIIQYIGVTNEDYVQGYFYKCVSDGAVEPTYSWEAIDTQDDTLMQVVDTLENVPKIDEFETGLYKLVCGNRANAYGQLDILNENGEYERFTGAPDIVLLVCKEMMEYPDDNLKIIGCSYLFTGRTDFVENISVNLATITGYYEEVYENDVLALKDGVYCTSNDYQKKSMLQFVTMPQASELYFNKFVQYTGDTNQNYTNGYFYKCVYNNGAYNWKNINTQEDNGIYFLGSASDYTQQTPLNLNNLTAQKYLIYSNATEIYVTGTYNNKTSILKIKIAGSYTLSPAIIFDMQKVLNDDLANSTVFAQVRYSSMASSELDGVETSIKTDSALGISQYSGTYGLTYFENPYSQQTISAKRTFQQAPVCTGEITADNNLITKKYADDKALTTLYTQSGLTEYNNTSTYAVDDYVYYNNLIYKCNTAVTVAEDFDSNKWTQKTYTEYWYELLIGTALGGSY